MKRIMFLLPALLLSLLLTGCGRAVSETPDSYLPSIMLDGVLYHLSDKGEMSNNEWTLFVADDLTLDDVVRLSKKGDKLGWEDFAQYKSKDVGSGLYILLYDIDDGYSLAIGGVPDEKPMYMRLSYDTAFSDDCIDIRTGDVEAFIKTRK